MPLTTSAPISTIRCGMVGFGMIFDDTYRPLFERFGDEAFYSRVTGPVGLRLAAVATRTGSRAAKYLAATAGQRPFANFAGPNAVDDLLASGVDVVCVATPDDRHFHAARAALDAGKHVLI